jgi:hypothetical protein
MPPQHNPRDRNLRGVAQAAASVIAPIDQTNGPWTGLTQLR